MVLIPWTCSTIQVACSWHWFTSAVNDNEDPNGAGPGLRFSLTHIPAWVAGVADTFFVTNIFLADAVFVWRCWTVWNRRWVVIALPALAAIAGLVLGALLVQYQVEGSQAGTPAIAAKFAGKFVALATVYFSLSVATSLSTTLLIALRIVLVQRGTRRHLGRNASNFNPIIEILVESAALYSATLIIFVASDVNKSPNLTFAQDVHSQIAGLAPLLIILRIFAGGARPLEDWSLGISGKPDTSSIEFAPSRSTLFTSTGRSTTSHGVAKESELSDRESKPEEDV